MSNMRKKLDNSILIIYLMMILIIGAIVIYLQMTNGVPDRNETAFKQFYRDIVWYDEQNQPVEDTDNLVALGSDNHFVYTVLPEDLNEHMDLCFRQLHLLFSAYVDGECIYEQALPESRFYTNSTGTNWIFIPLKQSYAGKRLCIYYEMSYFEKGVGFNHVAVGDGKEYLIHLIKEKAVSVVLSLIYVVIGLVLVILDVALYKFMKNRHNLMWLGFLGIGVGCYCMAEAQILPVFIADQRIMHLMSMLCMAVVPIPAIAYADSLFGFKYDYMAPAFSVVSFVAFIVLTVLNFFDIMDYHKAMMIFHILLLAAMIMMIYAIIRYTFRIVYEKKKIRMHIRFTIAGFVCIMMSGIIDILRFWFGSSDDVGKYVRIGFLLFLACFTVASSEQIIDAFRESMRTKLISRLAYEDGLTGLKNRTSYNEALEEIVRENKDTGIVMMDVNNLKLVNDNVGHDAGDEMLTYTSEIIRDAFRKEGIVCYRIGGDEFVALIQTNQIKEDCEKGIRRLQELYEEFNVTTNCRFKIVIAAGYKIYDHMKSDTLEDVIKMADSIMYSEKRRLKKMQA